MRTVRPSGLYECERTVNGPSNYVTATRHVRETTTPLCDSESQHARPCHVLFHTSSRPVNTVARFLCVCTIQTHTVLHCTSEKRAVDRVLMLECRSRASVPKCFFFTWRSCQSGKMEQNVDHSGKLCAIGVYNIDFCFISLVFLQKK